MRPGYDHGLSWFTALRREGRGSEGDRKGFLDDIIITVEHGKRSLQVQRLQKVPPSKKKNIIFDLEGITTVTLGVHTCVRRSRTEPPAPPLFPYLLKASFWPPSELQPSYSVLICWQWRNEKPQFAPPKEKLRSGSEMLGGNGGVWRVWGWGGLGSALLTEEWSLGSFQSCKQYILPGLRRSMNEWSPSPGWTCPSSNRFLTPYSPECCYSCDVSRQFLTLLHLHPNSQTYL